MIKINLALRKQAAGAVSAATSGGLTGTIKLGKIDADALRDLPIRQILLPIVVGGMASFFLDGHKQQALEDLESQHQQIMAERPKLESDANKLKSYEDLKKKLDADENTIRTKTETIVKLIAGRSDSTKMLIALANVTPKETWVSSYSVKSGEVKIKGYAMSHNEVSDLLKSLSESAYFGAVNPPVSTEDKDDTGTKAVVFEVTAKKRGEP